MQYQPLYSPEQLLSLFQQIPPDDTNKRKEYWDVVKKEIANFDSYCNSQNAMLVTKLWTCIKMIGVPQPNIEELMNTVDSIAESIIMFSELIGKKYKSYVDLRYKFDISGNRSTFEEFSEELLRVYKFTNIGFGDAVCMLSDIYASINSLRYGDKQDVKMGTVSSFRTKKFFIKPEHVTRVKIEICSNIPVFRYGVKQGVSRAQNKPGRRYSGFGHMENTYDNEGDGDSTKVTSVHFDNQRLRFYHDKIYRKEGSSSLKVKWTGTESQNCSIELKRTSFVLDHKIKDKIDLPQSKIGEFISGSLRPRQVTRENLNTFSSDDNIKAISQTMQKLVDKFNLKPTIQTQCSRVTFHRATRTGIQINCDTDILYCKETGNYSSWCADISSHPTTTMFPLAVLSIRIPHGTNAPDWLNALMDSEYVIPANKFNKFIHGTSKFESYRCDILPGWYGLPYVHCTGYPLRQWYRTNFDVGPSLVPLSSIPQSISKGGKGKEKDIDEIDIPSSDSDDQVPFKPIITDLTKKSPSPPKAGITSPKGALSPKKARSPRLSVEKKDEVPPFGISSVKGSDSTIVALRESIIEVKPNVIKQEAALPPTSPIWAPTKESTSSPPPDKSSKFLGIFRRKNKVQKVTGLTPLVTPIRVEPKTHFANERTLLQWVNICLFMALGSFAFLQLTGEEPRALGIGVLALALLFIIYALAVFHYRRHAIVSRSVDGHYDDKFGPTILVGILFVYIIASLVIQLTYIPPVPITTATRAVRDYRIPLSPSFLATPDLTSNGLNNLKSDIQNNIPQFPLKGNFNYQGSQNVTWYDTRNSCILNRNGFVLREITGADYFGQSTTNSALLFSTEDYEYISQMDLTYSTTFFNATETVRPDNTYHYGRERYESYHHNPDYLTLQNLATKYNTFFLWDFIPQASWGELIDAVNTQSLIMYYYGTVNTNFGNGGNSAISPSRLASISVYIWYLPTYEPVWGELSVSFPIYLGQDLSKQDILDAKFFFDQLEFMTKYFDTSQVYQDVEDVVYGQASYCI